MSIDMEAIPDEAVEAAERAATAKCSHEDISDCWQECSDIRDALTAAAPLLRAPLVAEVERLRAIVEAVDELRELWQRALEREGNLASAVADVIWKATQFGETEDGDTAAYIVPKGCLHRLVGVAQSNGAHVPVAFRNESAQSASTTEAQS